MTRTPWLCTVVGNMLLKWHVICMLKAFSRFRKSKYKFIAMIGLFIATFLECFFTLNFVIYNISAVCIKQQTSKHRTCIPTSASSVKDSRNILETGEGGCNLSVPYIHVVPPLISKCKPHAESDDINT